MRYAEHKKANKILVEIIGNPDQYYIVHYSCESFYDITDGRTPRITSIAIRNFDTAQTDSFSIHKVAEKSKIGISQIENNYDELEKSMLISYFDFLEKHQRCKFLHWNMRDINYGFKAIEHRYEVLADNIPFKLADEQKIDVARLFVAKYGVKYIGHPRLEKLLEKNRIEPKDFLQGQKEATAFVNKEYIKLHQSTLRKVDTIADLVTRAANNSLETNSKWWDIYGFSINGILEFLRSRWWGQFVLCLLSIILGIVIGKLLGV